MITSLYFPFYFYFTLPLFIEIVSSTKGRDPIAYFAIQLVRLHFDGNRVKESKFIFFYGDTYTIVRMLEALTLSNRPLGTFISTHLGKRSYNCLDLPNCYVLISSIKEGV